MTLFDLIGKGGSYAFSDHDLAVLADWAHTEQKETPNPDWKRAYALIREGADLLLRRRARSSTSSVIPKVEAYVDQPAFGLASKTEVCVSPHDEDKPAIGLKRCGKLMCHEADCLDCYPSNRNALSEKFTKKSQR